MQALRRIQPTVMFVTHGESSSATCQPVNDLGILCHKYGPKIEKIKQLHSDKLINYNRNQLYLLAKLLYRFILVRCLNTYLINILNSINSLPFERT